MQRRPGRFRRLVTLARILRKAGGDELVPLRIEAGHELRGQFGKARRFLAGQQVISDHADRVDVGAMIGRLHVARLGRHEIDRTHKRPGGRDTVALERRRGAARAPVFLFGHGPREAEVRDLRVAAFLVQHIGRLQVAVNDAGLVRVGQAQQDLPHHALHVRDRRAAAGLAIFFEPFLEGATIDIFQHEVELALTLPEVGHVDDVVMLEPGQHRGLTLEPFHKGFFLRQRRRQGLEREVLFQGGVLHEVDHAHAALAEHALHLVLPDHVPGLEQIIRRNAAARNKYGLFGRAVHGKSPQSTGRPPRRQNETKMPG